MRIVLLGRTVPLAVEFMDVGLQERVERTGTGVVADVRNQGLDSEAKKQVVEGFERSCLLGALRRGGGNISRTAEAIGMVRQSLQQKIRELGLRSEDWGNGD